MEVVDGISFLGLEWCQGSIRGGRGFEGELAVGELMLGDVGFVAIKVSLHSFRIVEFETSCFGCFGHGRIVAEG